MCRQMCSTIGRPSSCPVYRTLARDRRGFAGAPATIQQGLLPLWDVCWLDAGRGRRPLPATADPTLSAALTGGGCH